MAYVTVYSDSFTGAGLSAGWVRQSVNTATEVWDGTGLTVSLAGGQGYTRSLADCNIAPGEDFTVEVELAAGNAGRMQGAAAVNDTGNGMTAAWFNNPNGLLTLTTTNWIYPGNFNNAGGVASYPSRLRLIKTGTTYTAQYSTNGGTTWSAASGSLGNTTTITRLGILDVINNATPTSLKITSFVVRAEEQLAPPAPTNLSTVSLNNAVLLQWVVGGTGANAPTTQEVRVNGGAPITIGTVDDHLFTGLTNGTSYTIEVRGKNRGGTSPWSSVTVTPNGPGRYDAVVLADNPAWYAPSQDAGAGTFGEVVSGKHGTLVASTTRDTTNPAPPTTLGYAVRFDGTSGHLQLPTDYTFVPTNGWTWECWYYHTAVRNYERLLDMSNVASTSDILFYRYQTGGRLYVHYGGAVTDVGSFPALNTWNHVVVSVEPDGTMTYYLNAVPQGTFTKTQASAVARQFKYVGRSSYASDLYMAGSITRPAMYHAPLSAARVETHYNVGMESSTAPTGLVPNLQATPLNNAALVTWNSAVGIAAWDLRVNGGAITEYTARKNVISGLVNGVQSTIEVRLKNIHGVGPWTPVTVTPKVTYLYDDFDRANSTTSIGSPIQGGPYTVQTGGTWGIQSNMAHAYTAPEAGTVTAPGGWDVDIRMGVSGTNPTMAVLFRWRDINNTWMARSQGNGQLQLYRRQAGTWNQMALSNAGWVLGDVLRVVAYGRWISVYKNDALLLQMRDSFSLVTDTGIGMRPDVAGQRADSLVAYAPIAAEFQLTGGLANPSAAGTTSTPSSSFVYKGRDTKTEDTGSVA